MIKKSNNLLHAGQTLRGVRCSALPRPRQPWLTMVNYKWDGERHKNAQGVKTRSGGESCGRSRSVGWLPPKSASTAVREENSDRQGSEEATVTTAKKKTKVGNGCAQINQPIDTWVQSPLIGCPCEPKPSLVQEKAPCRSQLIWWVILPTRQPDSLNNICRNNKYRWWLFPD